VSDSCTLNFSISFFLSSVDKVTFFLPPSGRLRKKTNFGAAVSRRGQGAP
jgi:hypothetical protein